MNPTVEAALIGIAGALFGVVGTVIVAITGARNTRQINQATIDAAHADADRAQAAAREALKASREDAQRTLDAAREALAASREAQFADRYSRAIDQLGSDILGIRIGGIYALGGIALDSPARYQSAVIEVLTAFIREYSRTPPDGTRPQRRPPPDLQAALSLVGGRKSENDIRHMDLTGADLAGADLNRASLGGASLNGASLNGAYLIHADLTGADLTGADLTDAHLNGAHLNHACLIDAHFTGADLSSAHLTLAELTRADFAGARLTRTKWPVSIPIPTGWEATGGPEEQGRVFLLKRARTHPDTADDHAEADDANLEI